MVISKLCDLTPTYLSCPSPQPSLLRFHAAATLIYGIYLNASHHLLACRALFILFPLPGKSFLSLHHLCLNNRHASFSISLNGRLPGSLMRPQVKCPAPPTCSPRTARPTPCCGCCSLSPLCPALFPHSRSFTERDVSHSSSPPLQVMPVPLQMKQSYLFSPGNRVIKHLYSC